MDVWHVYPCMFARRKCCQVGRGGKAQCSRHACLSRVRFHVHACHGVLLHDRSLRAIMSYTSMFVCDFRWASQLTNTKCEYESSVLRQITGHHLHTLITETRLDTSVSLQDPKPPSVKSKSLLHSMLHWVAGRHQPWSRLKHGSMPSMLSMSQTSS